MKISTVFFDLDGTLLPLNQDEFVKMYFTHLAAFLAPHGYEPEEFTKALWSGVTAMTKNDGRAINETVFWEDFTRFYGELAQNFPCLVIISILTQFFCFLNLRKEWIYRKSQLLYLLNESFSKLIIRSIES